MSHVSPCQSRYALSTGYDKKIKKTDWTGYYSKRKSFFSSFTQRFTFSKIEKFFEYAAAHSHSGETSYAVMELGGGNSCFAEAFCLRKEISCYDIADNNRLAVELFRKQKLSVKKHRGTEQDLTKRISASESYDFVYSVGLIEHFTPKERAQVIDNHFKYCKNSGYVLLSFPTPTRKYCFWRKVMELLHVWAFWDETPLTYDDIKMTLNKHGRVVRKELNNRLFLTQMLVLARKT